MLGLDSHRDSLAIRRRIGYCPGDLALWANLTGQQVIDYLANLRGGVDPARVAELAERMNADLTGAAASTPPATARRSG